MSARSVPLRLRGGRDAASAAIVIREVFGARAGRSDQDDVSRTVRAATSGSRRKIMSVPSLFVRAAAGAVCADEIDQRVCDLIPHHGGRCVRHQCRGGGRALSSAAGSDRSPAKRCGFRHGPLVFGGCRQRFG
jgi:hypothetical protein